MIKILVKAFANYISNNIEYTNVVLRNVGHAILKLPQIISIGSSTSITNT